MNDSNVSIIIRVNDSEAAKLSKVAVHAKVMGDATEAAAADLAMLDATQRAAAASAEHMAAAQDRAAKKISRLHAQAIAEDRARTRAKATAEIAAIEKSERLHAAAIAEDRARERAKTAAQEAELRKRGAAELAAQEKMDRLHAAAIAEDIARERANTAAREAEARKREALELASLEKLDRLQTQAIIEDRARERAKTAAQQTELRKRELAELASQEKLDALHAAAIAEDIARERAKTAAVVREAEKQAAARRAALTSISNGTLSYAGVGFGANALGAGLGTAGVTVYASRMAIEYERAEQSLAAVSGSLFEAQRAMAASEDQARRLGVSITGLLPLYARFEAASKGTNLEGEKARDIFYAVAEAAQRLSLRAEDTEGVLRAVEQMMSKGTIQAEELRGQLGDRLPGAFQIMARAAGVSTAELGGMLKRGEVIADEMLPKFAAELRKTFNTDASTRIETTAANFQRLQNEIKQTAADAGQRLNPRLSEIASYLADFVAFSRENPGVVPLALFGRGAQGLDQIDFAVQRFAAMREHAAAAREEINRIVFNPGALVDQAMRPGAASDFYGPGTPYRPDPIDLTAGVAPPDEKRMAALREELALMGRKTEYANHVERALALQVARRRDELDAEKEAKKVRDEADKAADRLAEQELQRAVDREQSERDQIRAAMTRSAIMAEELATGERVTQGRRVLIDLEMQRVTIGDRTLQNELNHLDTIERQLRARAFYSDLFDQMARDAERSTDEVSIYAERAAQNSHDVLARYLFDPFKADVDEMVLVFADAMRRMAAEAAAASILEHLVGGNGRGGLLGPLITAGIGMFASAQFGAVDFAAQDPFGPVQYLGLPGAKSGGYVVGPGGPTDDRVLARLSAGEYVMKASAVRAFGKDFFDSINAGRRPPRFAEGGMVGPQGAGQPPPGFALRIVNAFDTQVIGDYMTSSEGEVPVVNILRRNGALIRQLANGALV